MIKLIPLLLASLSFNAVAITQCGPYKMTHIKSQKANILVAVKMDSWTGSVWKKLGVHSDSEMNSYQSIAQQAIATDAQVYLDFEENNYNCQTADYVTKIRGIMLKK